MIPTTQPKTIEERINKVIEGIFCPCTGKCFCFKCKEEREEATKAIMEIVEEKKTNPPTSPADKTECKHDWRQDKTSADYANCVKCGEMMEISQSAPTSPQPDMEEMKEEMAKILEDLPYWDSSKIITATLDFLLANYTVTKKK